MAESCTLEKTIQRSLRGSSVVAPTALGANMSQETDDMHDDLFKKYVKVVYKSSDKKSPISEVDAECLAFAVALAKIASDVKAADIKLLFVKPLVYWAKFFLITTAFFSPQIDAIRTRISDLAEKQYGKFSTGDTKANSWTLLGPLVRTHIDAYIYELLNYHLCFHITGATVFVPELKHLHLNLHLYIFNV